MGICLSPWNSSSHDNKGTLLCLHRGSMERILDIFHNRSHNISYIVRGNLHSHNAFRTYHHIQVSNLKHSFLSYQIKLTNLKLVQEIKKMGEMVT